MNAQFISEEQKKAGKEKCRLIKATKEERTNTTDTMKKTLVASFFFQPRKVQSLSLCVAESERGVDPTAAESLFTRERDRMREGPLPRVRFAGIWIHITLGCLPLAGFCGTGGGGSWSVCGWTFLFKDFPARKRGEGGGATGQQNARELPTKTAPYPAKRRWGWEKVMSYRKSNLEDDSPPLLRSPLTRE